MNLAIIPARGGSKRIPGKNIKGFLGKPIITYSIQTALASGLFEEVMVSTDDNEITKISEKAGAIVPFIRSDKNADDFATTADVIEEVLIAYRNKGVFFKNVCCIYPTAPFVNVNLLNEAFAFLQSGEIVSAFPVQRFEYPIWRSFNRNNDGLLDLNFPENVKKRSQDLPDAYHDAGQFYWLNVEQFLKTKEIFTSRSKGIIVDSLNAHDIDTPEDWKLAEIKYQLLHGRNDAVQNSN